MDEQQIRRIVREEVEKGGALSTYSTLQVPRHVHNGVDSPFITNTTLTYVGYIRSDGSEILIPNSWSAERLDVGTYTIRHNRANDLLYSAISVTATGATVTIPISTVSPFYDEINVVWFDALNLPAKVDTNFQFTVTTINNSSPGFPLYNV